MFDAGTVFVGVELGGLNVFLSGWKAAAATVAKAGSAMIQGAVDIAKSTATAGDQIQKMSQRIGFSTEGLSQMGFALEQSGASLGDLETSMLALTRAARDSQEGNRRASDTFARLGVSVKNATGQLKGGEQLFSEVSASLRTMGTGTQQAADAMTLLGRSGTRMIPLVNSNVAALREEADRLGLTWKQVSANAAALFNDEVNRSERAFSGFRKEIGEQLLPILQGVYTRIANLLPALTEWLNRTQWVGETLAWVGRQFGTLWTSIVTGANSISVAIETVATGLVDTMADAVNLVLRGARKLVDFWTIDLPLAAADGMWKIIQHLTNMANLEGAGGVFQKLMGVDVDAMNTSLDVMRRGVLDARTVIKDLQVASSENESETTTWFEKLKTDFANLVGDYTVQLPGLIEGFDALVRSAGEIPPALTAAVDGMGAVGTAGETAASRVSKAFTSLRDTVRNRMVVMGNTAATTFGQMVASGASAGDAIKGALVAAVSQIAQSEGQMHWLAGMAQMHAPGMAAQGRARMARGFALMAFGAALGAMGSSGGGGGGGGGAANGGAEPSQDTPGFQVEDREKDRPTVQIIVQGDMFDSDTTGNRIVELINEATDRNVLVRREAVALA